MSHWESLHAPALFRLPNCHLVSPCVTACHLAIKRTRRCDDKAFAYCGWVELGVLVITGLAVSQLFCWRIAVVICGESQLVCWLLRDCWRLLLVLAVEFGSRLPVWLRCPAVVPDIDADVEVEGKVALGVALVEFRPPFFAAPPVVEAPFSVLPVGPVPRPPVVLLAPVPVLVELPVLPVVCA